MPKRSRRSNYTKEEIKKNREKFFGVKQSVKDTNKERNSRRGVAFNNSLKDSSSSSSKTTKQGKPKTKAQLLATKNIKKYGGTAKAAEANKAAMKLKIKKAYLAKKNKKK